MRLLLMDSWDPINVNGVPEAIDEYDGYLGPLANKLREGADAKEVAEYLAAIQTDGMGLPIAADRLIEAGGAIVQWYTDQMSAADAQSSRR